MTTPMQEQYNDIKSKHEDCILLFRLGDFYEAFNDDAKTLAKVLGITLTGRGKGEKRIPMAGIPYHALNQYLPKLVKSGEKVAIAEQIEDASEAQGKIVERDVVKIITSGTITDDKNLDESKNNYLAAINYQKVKKHFIWGISIIDLTTGDFYVTENVSEDIKKIPTDIINLLEQFKPNEVLMFDKDYENFSNIINTFRCTKYEYEYAKLDESINKLNQQFETKNLKGFGIDGMSAGIIAASEVLKYLEETQKTKLNHIKKIQKIEQDRHMVMDEATIRNLELVDTILSENYQNTLYSVLNECKTSMGQRLLRNWLLSPLKEESDINARIELVEYFYNHQDILGTTREYLNNIYDIERLLGRIGLSSANARDLKALESSLESIMGISEIDFPKNPQIENIRDHISNLSEVNYIIDLIKNSIIEDPDINITEGNIIKDGFDSDLDQLRKISRSGKSEIINLQQEEIKKTNINSLKVKFNNVFGYYIEISKANLDKVPDNYVRKQTLVNAERFITPELKTLEEEILTAKDKIVDLEYKLFIKVRNDISQYIPSLQELSKLVAKLDIISNFAHQALLNNYTKPEFNETSVYILEESRHPVVEKLTDEQFITNDLNLDKNNSIMILTGPNMSGKSTYIRQVALISLMAQIGSFVPASKAILPVVDRIFTRVGAGDNLVKGESTFMVEMNETANILNNATSKSLIILDEIGRGTSTYDGVSLAWAITEYIHDKIGATTLFATHYHELVELNKTLKRIVNYNVEVKETTSNSGERDITFMRKIIPGSADKSYGIHVAKLAGIPKEVVSRADDLLERLESTKQASSKSGLKVSKPVVQFSFVDENNSKQENVNSEENSQVDKELEKIIEDMKNIDINKITPIESLTKLQELKDRFSKVNK